VDIRATAREAGSRTKIAVSSRDDAIDPVGACVGLKGSRVQAVVNELGGERIDIVPWSPDPERFAKLALAPARVARVFSDPDSKTIQAIVDEDQLSLAIGRNGQNVRLASELTAWKIDLYSSREWLERGGEGPLFAPLPAEEDEAVRVALSEMKGLPAELIAVLEQNGKKTLQDVLDLEQDEVERLQGARSLKSGLAADGGIRSRLRSPAPASLLPGWRDRCNQNRRPAAHGMQTLPPANETARRMKSSHAQSRLPVPAY
jgi:N utilization substance protein A